jgi:hypothetical protein
MITAVGSTTVKVTVLGAVGEFALTVEVDALSWAVKVTGLPVVALSLPLPVSVQETGLTDVGCSVNVTCSPTPSFFRVLSVGLVATVCVDTMVDTPTTNSVHRKGPTP